MNCKCQVEISRKKSFLTNFRSWLLWKPGVFMNYLAPINPNLGYFYTCKNFLGPLLLNIIDQRQACQLKTTL